MILTSSLPRRQARFHTPVLLSEVIGAFGIEKGKKYIDATIGGGGYSFEILKRGGIVLGIDKDPEAIQYVREKLEDRSWTLEIKNNLFLEQGNFANLKEIALSNGFEKAAGIIFDLGMSTYQLEGSGRGFSYGRDEPLDMRMDKRQKLTATEIVNNSSKERLYEIFTKYAEELHSRAIAEAIVRARSINGEIKRTSTLVRVIDDALERIHSGGGQYNKFKLLQGTKARIFQAIRIIVNNELECLNNGITKAIDLLDEKGRIAVLSYHSLEDRLIKLKFKKLAGQAKLKIITPVPTRADRKEFAINPKAKGVKLRIGEKV